MNLKQLLFPSKCVFCNRILLKEEKHICSQCEKQFSSTRPTLKQKGAFFDIAYGFLSYSGKVRQAMHRYKYYGKIHYAEYFAENMSVCYGREESALPHVITAVPSQKSRTAKRGFDHTFLLADKIGKRLNIPTHRMLRKTKNTGAMYGLSPERRRANIRGSIALSCPPDEVRGKHILLVDDILTTGSTASECARILKSAGAKRVTVLVAAMTEKKS